MARAFFASLATLLLILSHLPAQAAAVYSGGKLAGFTDVNAIAGRNWNVTFSGGTCMQLFSGCDNNSDFPSDGTSDNQFFKDALLSLIQDANGVNADTDPTKVAGCSFVPYCYIVMPYSLNGDSDVLVYGMYNSANIDGAIYGNVSTSLNSLQTTYFTWAVWSEVQATAVPEPTSLALVGLALAGAGVARLRKRA